MKSSIYYLQFIFVFLTTVLFPGVRPTFAQEVEATVSDSVQAAETVEMADISLRSSEVSLKTKRLSDKLIKEEELLQMKKESDSLVTLIELRLQSGSQINLTIQSTRKLQNKLIFWKQEQALLEDQVSSITSVLHELDDSKYSLSREASKWKNTEQLLEDEEFAEAIHTRIADVLKTIDTALNAINEKSNIALIILDKIMILDANIETRIDDIESSILNKQQQLFVSNQRSFFSINYTEKNNWNLSESIVTFYRVELQNLKNYIGLNIGILLFHILLIIALIILFIYLNRMHIKASDDEGAFFIKRFKVILSRPVSAALIIGLFASVILYPNKPLVFNDLMRFLVIIPIVLILIGILHRRYHIYVYSFGAVILLQLVYINLPSSNIISRFILFFIALIEAAALSYFIYRNKRQDDKKNKLTGFILILCYIHLVMALIGLFGNILGKVRLSEFFLFTVAGNALAATLIALSLVVVNGFTVLFIESKFAGKANVVKRNRSFLIKKTTRLFNIAALIILIYYLLKIIGWETAVYDGIIEWFTKEREIGSMLFSWSKLFVFFFVIWLSIVVSKIVRVILEDDVLNKMKLEKGLPHTISMMVKYSLVTIGIFLAVSAAGFPMSEFTIIFGAFGVGIGFGLQNIFNNLVSGLILLFERPIKIGDTIEVGTLMGNVRSIGIRSSNVRTFDGAEIIVPNGNLISNEVVNWTLSDQRRRIEVIVGVSYSSDPHKVHEVLLKILKEHKDVVDDPEPNVFFRDLGESSLDFRMLFWTYNFDQWIRIRSEIIFKVFDELKAAGIEIPFPQHDLHLRSIDKHVEFPTNQKQGKKK